MVTGAPLSQINCCSSCSPATLVLLYGSAPPRNGAVSSAVPCTSTPCTVTELTWTIRRTPAAIAASTRILSPCTLTSSYSASGPQGPVRAAQCSTRSTPSIAASNDGWSVRSPRQTSTPACASRVRSSPGRARMRTGSPRSSSRSTR